MVTFFIPITLAMAHYHKLKPDLFLIFQHLEKSNAVIFPESIKLSTRDQDYYFSMFVRPMETFGLMEQLANIAMRQLLSEESFEQDKDLPTRTRIK